MQVESKITRHEIYKYFPNVSKKNLDKCFSFVYERYENEPTNKIDNIIFDYAKKNSHKSSLSKMTKKPKSKNLCIMKASSKRIVGDPKLFESNSKKEWEAAYKQIMDKKYAKNTRNFNSSTNSTLRGGAIFIVPRIRTDSYKRFDLKDGESTMDKTQVFYAAISKGFGGQDISSFTMGPIIGEGLCLVNAAFSKSVCIKHIEGGGKVNLARKNFWQKGNPKYTIKERGDDMYVNGKLVEKVEWLRKHEGEWLEEWESGEELLLYVA